MNLLAVAGGCAAWRRKCTSVALSVALAFPAAHGLGADVPSADEDADDALAAVPVGVNTKALAPRPGATPGDLTPTGKLATQAPAEEVWMLPPIPWRASITLGTDRSRSGSGPWTGSTFASLNAGASSYILAPWFLPFEGSTSFTRSKQSTGDVSDSVGAALSGNLMPRTLTPASFGASVAKTTYSVGGVENSSTFRTVDWAQTYNPSNGAYTSRYSLSDTNYQAADSSVSTRSLSASAGGGLPGDNPQTFNGNVGYSRTAQSGTGKGSESRRADVGHSIYLEDYVMTVSSDASINQQNVRGEGAQKASFGAAGSTMDWVPSDDYPLRLQAAARHFVSTSSVAGAAETEQRNTLANVTATYPRDKNWSFSAKGQVNRSETNLGSSASVYELNGNASYRGDGLNQKLQEFWDYNLNYRSSLDAAYFNLRSEGGAGSPESSDSRVTGNWSGGLGHTATRNVLSSRPGEIGSVRISQNVDAYKPLGDNSGPAGLAVMHSAAYSLAFAPSPSSSRSLSFSANDGRSFGATRSAYQSISAGATGIEQMNARESLSLNAGLPISRQGGGKWQGSAFASLGYGHARFANVSGLVYGAAYSLSLRPLDQGGPTTTNYKGWATNQTFNQNWSWRMGHLSWRITNALVLDEFGRTSASLGLSISRSFGGVL